VVSPCRSAEVGILATSLVLVLIAPSCVTRSQGEAMTQRIAALEKQLQSDREEYTKLAEKAERDVAELEDVLKTSTHAAASYAADTDSLREDIAKLEGNNAETHQEILNLKAFLSERENSMRDRLELVAAKVGLDPPLDPAKIPQEPAKLLAEADAARTKGDAGEARSLYRAFIDRNPNDPLADNVQLKIGQTYVDQQRYAQALTALNVVVDRYPDSDVMGETLYTMSESLYKMRSCNDAITLLQAVVQRYHDKTLVDRARSKLREVQQAKRAGCRP
jgi:TolA-binding protein